MPQRSSIDPVLVEAAELYSQRRINSTDYLRVLNGGTLNPEETVAVDIEYVEYKGVTVPWLDDRTYHANSFMPRIFDSTSPWAEEVREGCCNCPDCLKFLLFIRQQGLARDYASLWDQYNLGGHQARYDCMEPAQYVQGTSSARVNRTEDVDGWIRMCVYCTVPVFGRIKESSRVVNIATVTAVSRGLFAKYWRDTRTGLFKGYVCEVCQQTYSRDITTCNNCNESSFRGYATTIRDNRTRTETQACPSCAILNDDTASLSTCRGCSCYFIHATEDNDDMGCWQCYRRTAIRNYGYSPEIINFLGFEAPKKKDFQGSREWMDARNKWENSMVKKLFLGLELETEMRNDNRFERDNVSIAFNDAIKGIAYLKSDGSIMNGFEIVSHPATIEWWQDKNNPLFEAINTHLIGKCKSFYTNNCGIHIHMSISAFTRYQLMRFMRFIYNNEIYCNFIAQRAHSNYAKFSAEERKNVVNRAKHMRGNHDRYVAVNFPSNKPTIEIRMFRGNLSQPMVLKNLEFLAALFEFANNESTLNMTSSKFIEWVEANKWKYPTLAKYNENFKWKY